MKINLEQRINGLKACLMYVQAQQGYRQYRDDDMADARDYEEVFQYMSRAMFYLAQYDPIHAETYTVHFEEYKDGIPLDRVDIDYGRILFDLMQMLKRKLPFWVFHMLEGEDYD